MTRRLLTIGHSYVVAANRRLAHEMAREADGRWEITAVAPRRFRGDLRTIALEPIDGEADALRTIDVRFDRSPHFMWYRDLGRVLQERWDVVHCWEEPYVLAGAQIARAAPAAARFVVATFQNLAKRYPWPLSAFERATMTRANGWIAFGRTVHQTLASRTGYIGTPSRVLSPGVDVVRFCRNPAQRCRVLTRLGWPPSDPVVGFLGRFVPQKGITVLMDALRSVRSPWRALFVGGGPMESELRRFAAEHSGRVHVETGVAHHEVPAWLNAMTVLCAPSQTTSRWREQFGRMLIEAMACGVPVIGSDSGEIPFVIDRAGVVLPEHDTRAWTSTLAALLADDAARLELSDRGLVRAREQFAWPVVARRHLAFFEELVAATA